MLLNVHRRRRGRRRVHHFDVVREESLLEEVLATFTTLMSDVADMTSALHRIRRGGVEPVDRLTVLIPDQVLKTSEMFHCVFNVFQMFSEKFQQIFISKTIQSVENLVRTLKQDLEIKILGVTCHCFCVSLCRESVLEVAD